MEKLINLSFLNGDTKKIVLVIISVFICILGLLLKNAISKGILNVILNFACKNDTNKKQTIKTAMVKPISFLIFVLMLFAGISINVYSKAVVKGFKIAIILIICWCITSFLSTGVSSIFKFGKTNDDKLNTTAIKFINNILKILIIIFAVVMIISELGYNINGLITGIGVGGLAVSLAAQDAVSNLISGFIIIFEKPFKVGDLIETPTIKGNVVEVKMRSTTIRSLDDSVVTVPNSNLTKDAVTNLSAMDKRRIKINFGLLYNTPNETLIKCKKDIEQYCIDSNDILPTPLRVHFTEFGDSSIDFEIICYTLTSDLDEYLNVLETLNLSIKKIIENNNTDFAYPTTSVYLQNN